jgi:methyl-accepting chemotaxis protein
MKKRISKKTLLHDEVQSRISKMLYNKYILYKNNPVDNTETNARLIKSFLYRKISSKYPKYNSFTKISTIHNLNDNELSNLLQDLPNLDEWYATIQEYKEKKNLIRKNQSNLYDEEEDIEDNIENIVEYDNEINTVVETVNTTVETVNTTVETVNTTVETVNTTVETVNTNEKFTSSNEDELTNSEVNELNENLNLTDKIFVIVKKIVIVYAFYKLAKLFI